MIDGLLRAVADRHERREDAENFRRQQRRRRPLAGDVADQEAELPVGHVLHVEEVAADRARACTEVPADWKKATAVAAFRQQRLLDFRGDLQLVLDARLLERLAIEARVFDRHAGFGRQRVERGARVRRQQAALLAAVEIQHADVPGLALHVRAIEVADHAQRDARDVADAELHRAEVRRWRDRRRAGRRRSSARRSRTLLRESCGWS